LIDLKSFFFSFSFGRHEKFIFILFFWKTWKIIFLFFEDLEIIFLFSSGRFVRLEQFVFFSSGRLGRLVFCFWKT